jgi:hypothetical protein
MMTENTNTQLSVRCRLMPDFNKVKDQFVPQICFNTIFSVSDENNMPIKATIKLKSKQEVVAWVNGKETKLSSTPQSFCANLLGNLMVSIDAVANPIPAPLYISVEQQQKNANGEEDYFVVHPIIPLIHQLEEATAKGADALLGLLQRVPNAKGVEEIKQVLRIIHSIITAGKEKYIAAIEHNKMGSAQNELYDTQSDEIIYEILDESAIGEKAELKNPKQVFELLATTLSGKANDPVSGEIANIATHFITDLNQVATISQSALEYLGADFEKVLDLLKMELPLEDLVGTHKILHHFLDQIVGDLNQFLVMSKGGIDSLIQSFKHIVNNTWDKLRGFMSHHILRLPLYNNQVSDFIKQHKPKPPNLNSFETAWITVKLGELAPQNPQEMEKMVRHFLKKLNLQDVANQLDKIAGLFTKLVGEANPEKAMIKLLPIIKKYVVAQSPDETLKLIASGELLDLMKNEMLKGVDKIEDVLDTVNELLQELTKLIQLLLNKKVDVPLLSMLLDEKFSLNMKRPPTSEFSVLQITCLVMAFPVNAYRKQVFPQSKLTHDIVDELTSLSFKPSEVQWMELIKLCLDTIEAGSPLSMEMFFNPDNTFAFNQPSRFALKKSAQSTPENQSVKAKSPPETDQVESNHQNNITNKNFSQLVPVLYKMKTECIDNDISNGANVNDSEPNPKEDTEDEIKKEDERKKDKVEVKRRKNLCDHLIICFSAFSHIAKFCKDMTGVALFGEDLRDKFSKKQYSVLEGQESMVTDIRNDKFQVGQFCIVDIPRIFFTVVEEISSLIVETVNVVRVPFIGENYQIVKKKETLLSSEKLHVIFPPILGLLHSLFQIAPGMVDLICSILRTTPAIINVMKYSSEFATVTSSTEDAGASDWALPEEEFAYDDAGKKWRSFAENSEYVEVALGLIFNLVDVFHIPIKLYMEIGYFTNDYKYVRESVSSGDLAAVSKIPILNPFCTYTEENTERPVFVLEFFEGIGGVLTSVPAYLEMLFVKLYKKKMSRKNKVAPDPMAASSVEMDWIEDISFLATSGSDEKYELMTLRLLFDGEDHAWTLMALQRLFEEKVKVMTPTISIHDPKDGNFYWIFHFIKPIFETPEKVFLLTSTFIQAKLYIDQRVIPAWNTLAK